MARTVATNFTGALQYPYATAAGDIFKKEDVQTLAQAVDQHDHSSGKGLVLSATSIPSGFITSAMIADGTIVSADIADGTIAAVDMAAGAALANLAAGSISRSTLVAITAASTTTSVSFVASGVDVVAWSPVAGNAYVHATWTGQVSCTTKGAIIQMYLAFGGAASFQPTVLHAPDVSYGVPVQLDAYIPTAAAGVQNFQVFWLTNAGTLSMVSNRSILVCESVR